MIIDDVIVLVHRGLIHVQHAAKQAGAILGIVDCCLQLLFQLVLLIGIHAAADLLQQLHFLVGMLDALGVVSAVLVQMTTHVQAQIGSDGCKVEHQALPGAILHVLVVGCAVHLLDVAVDAHLVQHVGNGRQHIGHAADGDNVGGKTIGITSLCQQGLCLLRIIGKMIQAVVVGGGTGNCPLVGHLCHAHQECCVDGIHIDGVAQGAADTGIGPGAVNGTVGDQTQTLDTHAVLVIFLDVDACTVQLLKDGWTFPNFDYDGNFNDILDKIYNCNVYIGHEGIEGCLAEGADVVITGRAADSALFLAPLKYEFGWAADDWDNLARGIMAGHLLECGGQGAGGNYMYDWRNVPRMDELGFPIAELTDDTFEITKAPDCGGIICEQSCKEQFLYEVHDPANYLTPDVNVDISHATITQVGDNRVRIGGVKGKPRPDTLKLCVGYHKGWKTVSMLSFAWPDAYEKAQYCAEVIMKKMQRRGMKADDIHISYIGLNSLHLGVADMSEEALKNLNECVLRIAVFSEDKSECAKIIPEISPLQLNGPPGASFFGGRARVQEVMALWPTTVPRDAVQVESHILEVK